MSKANAGFGDVENPFGDVDLVEEYQPPAVHPGGWERQLPAAAEPIEDDEPFTAAHLAAATQGAVPAVRPAAAAASPRPPPPLPFTESVAPASRDAGGRMGPPPPPVPRQGAALDPSLLLGGGAPSSAPAPSAAEPDGDPSSYPLYSIKRYRTYFNVDTDEVLQRVYRAVALFFRGDFVEHLGGNPDLYGPFWIASTLVFVSAASGNLASYINYQRSSGGASPPPAPPGSTAAAGWYYDVDKVYGSMGLFYGYVGVIGLAMYLVLRWFQSGVGLAQVWCIYGYSLAAYIPMAALCVLPMEVARWALVGAATAVSGAFLVFNFRAPVIDSAGAKAAPVLLVVAGLHAALGLALKLYFFHYTKVQM